MARLCVLLLMVLSVGCGSRPADSRSGPDPEQLAREASARRNAESINTKLAAQSGRLANASTQLNREYRIGPGDELEISVFKLDELTGPVRVNSRGTILLPLLGSLQAEGRTAAELESEITRTLARDYMNDPQVTVFVSDYRAANITVAGAVRSPSVYSITRPHTLLEVLLMAGGVSPEAGYKVNVNTRRPDPETGEMRRVNLFVDLRKLMQDFDLNQRLVLSGGDSVFVQSAGYVFVEGMVKRPGSFKMDGEVDVLKALALAGGVEFRADHDDIKVFRQGAEGTEIFEIDYDRIRKDRSSDIALQDGDLVVVGTDALKTGVVGVLSVIRFVPFF